MTATDDFLAHFGVKGMHWGVRRERGSDGRVHGSVTVTKDVHLKHPDTGLIQKGTLTVTKGKSIKPGDTFLHPNGTRYTIVDKKHAVNPPSQDHVTASEARAKAKYGGSASLSNKELKTLVDRMNLEERYTKLNPKQVSIGKKAATVVAKNASEVVLNVGKQQGQQYLNKVITDALKKK